MIAWIWLLPTAAISASCAWIVRAGIADRDLTRQRVHLESLARIAKRVDRILPEPIAPDTEGEST